LYALELAPREWWTLLAWMVWLLGYHPRIGGPRRLLLNWRTGTRLVGATERHRTTLREALTAYATLFSENTGDRAGVCYILPDLGREEHTEPRRAIYFTTPPRVGLSAYLHEQMALPYALPAGLGPPPNRLELPAELVTPSSSALPAGIITPDRPDDPPVEDTSDEADEAIPPAQAVDAPDEGEGS
jgi:hypothetical protein